MRNLEARGCSLEGCPYTRPHHHVDDLDYGDRIVWHAPPERVKPRVARRLAVMLRRIRRMQ